MGYRVHLLILDLCDVIIPIIATRTAQAAKKAEPNDPAFRFEDWG
jgi:hypothetical protein